MDDPISNWKIFGDPYKYKINIYLDLKIAEKDREF